MDLNLTEVETKGVQIHGLLSPRHWALTGIASWCPGLEGRRSSVPGSVAWPWTGHFTFVGSSDITREREWDVISDSGCPAGSQRRENPALTRGISQSDE